MGDEGRGIDCRLLCDNAVGELMRAKKVDANGGADRVAANGDTANKVGTSVVAILCVLQHSFCGASLF